MRSEGYGSCRVSDCLSVCVCVCVCVSVCLSVKSHLTSGASVRPENSATYSPGNEGQIFCGVFSETVSFQSYSTSCIVRVRLPCSRPLFFLSAEYARALLKCHVDRGAEFRQYKKSSISSAAYVMLIYPRLSSAFLAHHSAY